MTTLAETTRFGVLLPTREQAMTGKYDARALLSFAATAEDLGFDSLWAGDSLTARPRFDPLVVLAAAAAVTTRITLGTAALTAALRNPVVGANTIAAIDQVSGGRLTLGLGAGFPIPETEAEFAVAGVPFRGRTQRLDELTSLWRHAWRGGAEFTGQYWQVDGLDRLPPPHRTGGPALWLACGDTPRALDRVARHYDGWLPYLPSAEAYGTAWREIVDRSVASGRPGDSIAAGLYATVAVGKNVELAREELATYVRHYYGRSLEQMAGLQAYCWGTAADCAEWLAEYLRAGARHVIIRIGSLDPAERLAEIAEVLLPMLRAAGVADVVSAQRETM